MKARQSVLHSRGLSYHKGQREKAEALPIHSSRAAFIDPCYPADNESGAECEREKEEERSQQ